MFVREGPVKVLRRSKPTINRDTGKYNKPEEKEVILRGSLQPVLGEDLKKLPSGFRVADSKVLFLHEELQENDIILYKGTRLHVNHKESWDEEFSPLPHYRYILTKDVER